MKEKEEDFDFIGEMKHLAEQEEKKGVREPVLIVSGKMREDLLEAAKRNSIPIIVSPEGARAEYITWDHNFNINLEESDPLRDLIFCSINEELSSSEERVLSIIDKHEGLKQAIINFANSIGITVYEATLKLSELASRMRNIHVDAESFEGIATLKARSEHVIGPFLDHPDEKKQRRYVNDQNRMRQKYHNRKR